jgi:hypothetical protein
MTTKYSAALAFLAALFIAVTVQPSVAQTVSSRTPAAGANDWFTAAPWSNGVPNSAGSVATLNFLTGTTSQIQLSAPVTLEQLSLNGQAVTTLAGGPLTFANDGAGDLAIAVNPSGSPLNVALATPLSFAADQTLGLDVGEGGTLTLNGAITATSGNLIKRGVGQLRLGVANTSWTGGLLIEGGEVVSTVSQALGSSSGATTIAAAGRLSLLHSAGEAFNIQGGTLQVANVNLSGPIAIAQTALLTRLQNPTQIIQGMPFETTVGTTNISSVISGAGNLEIRNLSRDAIVLSAANTYTGHTYLTAGPITASSSVVFGSAVEGTTIQGAAVTLQQATAEQFRVESGSLNYNIGFASLVPVTVAGGTVYFPNVAAVATPVIADGAGGTIRGVAAQTSFTGGSTGTGSLSIARMNIDAPLNHQGALTTDNVTINVANSYAGDTFIAESTNVNHVGAFGQSQNIHMQRGELRLNVLPQGTPKYFGEGGLIYFPDGAAIASEIVLGGPNDAAITGDATYNGPITLAPTTRTKHIYRGIVNGPISGTGTLRLGSGTNTLAINAANDIQGRVLMYEGIVNASHAEALPLEATNVLGGRLNVNAPAQGNFVVGEYINSSVGTAAFTVNQDITRPWVHHTGQLIAAGSVVGMDRLILLGGTNYSARLAAEGNGRFRIDDELSVFHHGGIDAPLAGAGTVRASGESLGINGDLSQFTGQIVAEHGQTYLSDAALNSFSGEVHVRDEGTLLFATNNDSEFIVDADIYLHNAHGDGRIYEGALVHDYYASEATLRGRLDIGNQGSTIVGNFNFEGPITGKNLTHRRSSMTFSTPQTQLTGTLRLDGGGLTVAGGGRLAGVDEILIENGALLSMPATNFAGVSDRIDDAVKIRSHGGLVYLYSGLHSGVETLGTMQLERGATRVMANSDHGTPSASLTINHIERSPGAILDFVQGWWSNNIKVNAPLEEGMIGGWAITETGFATLNSTGTVVTVNSTTNNFAGAMPSSHVNLLADAALTGDVTVASYRSNSADFALNLNGAQLTVTSGGVFRAPNISNGRLTAGTSAGPAELFLHDGGGLISAAIVDNAAGGSVALVVNEGRVRLSGANTYTGGTWVVGTEDQTDGFANGQLSIQTLAAIPAHDRVYVDHGAYSVEAIASGVVRLDEIHLRNDGRVRGGVAPIDADRMVLEDGLISAELTGDGAIRKTTDGIVELGVGQSLTYTGVITVEEGLLSLGVNTARNAQFVLKGGELRYSSTSAVASNFTLDGGTLSGGRLNGIVDVQGDSVLSQNAFVAGTLRGSGDLVIRGNPSNWISGYVGLFGNAANYTGDIRVESGSLRVGYPSTAGSGNITVERGGHLILGSNTYSNPATSLNNDVLVRGGTIYSTPPTNTSNGEASPSLLTGHVIVEGEAFIGSLSTGFKNGVRLPGLSFGGTLELKGGAEVYGLSDGRHSFQDGAVAYVEVAGELLVGTDVTWNLLTSSVAVTGVVRPSAASGSIDFRGAPDLLRLAGAEFQVAAGQNLAVTLNGGNVPLTLSGAGASLGGAGTIQGDFVIQNGAAISPGASPGQLTLDGNAQFGPGGILDIEIGGTALGSQYDQLNVLGEVDLTGAALDLSFLGGFIPAPSHSFVIVAGTEIHGAFANAQQSIRVGNVLMSVAYGPQSVVLSNAVVVPEPAAALLAGAAMALAAATRRRASAAAR